MENRYYVCLPKVQEPVLVQKIDDERCWVHMHGVKVVMKSSEARELFTIQGASSVEPSCTFIGVVTRNIGTPVGNCP